MHPVKSLRLSYFATALCCLFALTALLASSTGAWAQSAGPGKRRTGQTPRAIREGSAAYLRHYEPSNMLRLAIALTPPHPTEEKQFLDDLQNKNSPVFHQYLSAEEWTNRFGPTAESEKAVVDWAESQGLKVTHRYHHRLAVDVEGTVATIEKALNVTINRYELPASATEEARTVFSNDSDPVLPPQIDALVTGVMGLNSVEVLRPAAGKGRVVPQPDYVPGPSVQAVGGVEQAATAQGSAAASPTSGSTPQSAGGFLVSDMWGPSGYDYQALMNQGHCCNPTNNPSNSPSQSSIAIASFGDVSFSDLAGFHTGFPNLAYNVQKYYIDGTYTCNNTNGADDNCSEVTMDTEWSLAMANSQGSSASTAKVYVYEGSGYNNAVEEDLYNFMLEDGYARTMTTSWGIEENIQFQSNPETDSYNSTMQSIDNIFSSMVGQGWTLIAATGDQGSTGGCSGKLAVQFPSSSPNVLGAGGSYLKFGSTDATVEVAWTGGTFAGSKTQASSCDSNGGGGTGGVSEYFSTPSYQSGLGYSKRALPDLVLDAQTGHDTYFQGNWSRPGGTSVVAPMLAGFFAQENAYLLAIGNKCGSQGTSACAPLGNPLYAMYAEYRQPTAGRYPYYDITTGCTSNDETVDDHLTAWCAKTGYDLATGLGSANMLQLAWAINWETTTAFGYPYIQFSGPATNRWYNTNQTVSWTVEDYTGGTGLPGTGIAGETQGWDSIPSDPSSEPHVLDFISTNSFYTGPQFVNDSTGCLAFSNNGCAGNGGAQGCHTVHVEGWNNQGLSTGDSTYGPLCFDSVAPTIAVTPSPGVPYGNNSWYKQSVSLTLGALDPGGSNASGVAHMYYAINNPYCTTSARQNCTPVSGTQTVFLVNPQGVNTFTAFALDNAGNYSNVINETIKIDESAPATTAGFSGVLLNNMWESSVSISLSAVETLSGVSASYYTVDGGPLQTYHSPFVVSTPGNHTLTFYSSSVAGVTERSNTLNFTISSPTTTTLSTSANPVANGLLVILTATVNPTLGGTATGKVTFYNGQKLLGTSNLANGVATYSLTGLAQGTSQLYAVYGGATYELTSNSNVISEVVLQASTTTLTDSSLTPGNSGQVTFTATVKSSTATPTGSVQFFDGPTLLGSMPLTAGACSITVPNLPTGKNLIMAVYSGNATYATSTGVVSLTVSPAP